MLQFSTLNFDGLYRTAFSGRLCVGAGVVSAAHVVGSARPFTAELIQKRITVADLTTAYWFLLMFRILLATGTGTMVGCGRYTQAAKR